MKKLGPDSLSAQELLALILGRGVRGKSVSMTAQKLLSYFGSLEGIMNASLEDLQSVKGLGLAKASQLKACFEIARRVFTKSEIAEETKQKEITSVQEIYAYTAFVKVGIALLSFYQIKTKSVPAFEKIPLIELLTDSAQRNKTVSGETQLTFLGKYSVNTQGDRLMDGAKLGECACPRGDRGTVAFYLPIRAGTVKAHPKEL